MKKFFRKRKTVSGANSSFRRNRRRKPGSGISISPGGKLWASLIIFFITLAIFLQLRISYLTTEKDLQTKILGKQKLESELLPMRLEERYLTRLEVVEKVAKEELGLHPPKSNQIRRVIIEKKE